MPAISVEDFLLRKWPYSPEVCLIALIFTGCLKTRLQDPQKKWHPMHDFIHTFLNTFATGILGPLIVGEVPLPLTNDVIITLLVGIWFIFYRLDYIMVPFASAPGVYQTLVFFSTLSRANNVCAFTDKAFKRLVKLNAYQYYPVPLFGPIIVGIVRGAGGLVFPPEKGLSGLKNGLPFNAQIALVCATIWHLVVNDPFLLGGFLRGVLEAVGLRMFLEPIKLKCAIVVFFLAMNVIQSFKSFSSVNPFWPIWEVLYAVTGVERSPGSVSSSVSVHFKGLYDINLRKKAERLFDVFKFVFVLGILALFVYNNLPSSHLYAGQFLTEKDYLGKCTLLPQFRSCEPVIALVEKTGRIAVYKGNHPADQSRELLWASTGDKNLRNSTSDDGWIAILNDDGILSLQDGIHAKVPIWQSKLNQASKKARRFMVRAVLEDSGLNVYRSDILSWTSKTG